MRAEPGYPAAPALLTVAWVGGEHMLARRIAAALERAGLPVLGSDAPQPDAVVLACPRLDGEALDSLGAEREQRPEAALIVVTRDAAHREVREALEAGADAIVLESRVEDCLAESVLAAGAGQLVLPREWRDRVARPALSPREKQVLGMVVMGFTNQEIANKLLVAESTVKSHLTSIFAKLGVRGRSEAAALVLDPERGLGTGVLAIIGGEPR